jgi:hypothetical protein
VVGLLSLHELERLYRLDPVSLAKKTAAFFRALLHLSWHQAARPGSAGLRSPKLSIARPMSGAAEWNP